MKRPTVLHPHRRVLQVEEIVRDGKVVGSRWRTVRVRQPVIARKDVKHG